MTQALDAAAKAIAVRRGCPCIVHEEQPCRACREIALAGQRAALPAEAPAWFAGFHCSYTGSFDCDNMWADLRAHLLGEDE